MSASPSISAPSTLRQVSCWGSGTKGSAATVREIGVTPSQLDERIDLAQIVYLQEIAHREVQGASQHDVAIQRRKRSQGQRPERRRRIGQAGLLAKQAQVGRCQT